MQTTRSRLIAIALLLGAGATPSQAVEPVASFDYLVTGNGFGFQVFDKNANAIKQFLERPYRFMRPNSSNPDGEGIVRRNLVFDSYFGVRIGSQATWLGKSTPGSVGYVDQTNVIESVVTIGNVETHSYFFSPYGYDGNAMVMLIQVKNTGSSAIDAQAFALENFHMGSAPVPDTPGADGESVQLAADVGTETGPGGGVMVYLPIGGADHESCASDAFTQVQNGQDLSGTTSCSGTDKVGILQKGLGSIPAGGSAWWGMAVLFDSGGQSAAARTAFESWLGSDDASTLLDRVLGEWDSWRKPVAPGLSPAEARVWRQAEAVLRMGQVLEPWTASPKHKAHGMMLASLPPGEWHSGWVRDAAYAIVALSRSGHYDEARWALDFFLDAEADKYGSYLNDVTYRISTVRYFGDGEEEADYSGQTTRNIEIDGWGLFLWAARTYVDASGDTGWLDETTQAGERKYDVIKNQIADALASNLEPNGMAIADASIWEVHWGNRQHFLYTTAATARGFCDMAALARRVGDDASRTHFASLSENAVTAMRGSFIDQRNVLAGSLERLAQGSNYIDGATVEAFTWNLIPATDPIANATLSAFSHLQTPAGGYKRVEGSSDQYDTDEWILIDLRASDAWRRAGNSAQADELLGWVTAQASVNHDLVPELYNTRTQSGTIGAYSGSIPMVGYGAGAYIVTMLHRAQLFEPDDCGTVESYPDAGPIDYVDAAPYGDAGGFGATGRTGTACVCDGGGDPADGFAAGLLALAVALLLRRRRAR